MHVIDSLVVELGLDPRNFDKGQREALDKAKRSQREMLDQAKGIERTGDRVTAAISKLRVQALGLFALFVGSRGLSQFVEALTTSDASVSRLSRSLGSNVREMSAWRGAVTRTGGSVDGITGTIAGLIDQFQQFAVTGESSVIPWFRALNVQIADTDTGKMRSISAILLDLADRFSKMDPAQARVFARGLGIDEGTLNLLLKGRAAVEAILRDVEKLGTATEQDGKRAEELATAWNRASQAVTSMGRSVLNDISPELTWLLNQVTAFINWWDGRKARITRESAILGKLENLRAVTPSGWAGLAVEYLFNRSKGRQEERVKAEDEAKTPLGAEPKRTTMGTRADRNNNPGNIEYGPFARRMGAIGSDGRFAIFPDRETGFRAARELLQTKGYRGLTLPEIGARWAEGDPNWARNASRATGLPMDRPLTDQERVLLANKGITAAEGSKFGPWRDMVGAAEAGNVNNSRTSSTSIQVGQVVVNTPATDGAQFARDFKSQLEIGSLANQAQQGAN